MGLFQPASPVALKPSCTDCPSTPGLSTALYFGGPADSLAFSILQASWTHLNFFHMPGPPGLLPSPWSPFDLQHPLSPAHSSQRAMSSAHLKSICMLSASGLPLPSPPPVTLGLGFPPQKSLHVLRVDFPITPLHWGQLLGCQHTRAVYAR